MKTITSSLNLALAMLAAGEGTHLTWAGMAATLDSMTITGIGTTPRGDNDIVEWRNVLAKYLRPEQDIVVHLCD